ARPASAAPDRCTGARGSRRWVASPSAGSQGEGAEAGPGEEHRQDGQHDRRQRGGHAVAAPGVHERGEDHRDRETGTGQRDQYGGATRETGQEQAERTEDTEHLEPAAYGHQEENEV